MSQSKGQTSAATQARASGRSDDRSARTQPFLKWPGGKRWIAAEIADLAAEKLVGTYYEPFLGGGAVYFALNPARAILTDINAELILTYKAVQKDAGAVEAAVRRHPVTAAHYYRVRDAQPRTVSGRAARFLYLNRTSFAGLYRENANGKFNVPFGGGERTPEILWRSNLLRQAAVALRGARLRVSDFEAIVDRAGRGDVVYCDPCYAPFRSTRERFTRYYRENFNWEQQARLASAARRAQMRGAFVMVSNIKSVAVASLYRGCRSLTFRRYSPVSRNREHRRYIDEFLFLLPPK